MSLQRSQSGCVLVVVMLMTVLVAGCGGGGGSSGVQDTLRAQQEAAAAWLQVADLTTGDEVDRPTVEDAQQGFLRALQYDSRLASANVGYSVCQAALTADTLDTKYGLSRSRIRTAAECLKGFPAHTAEALKAAAAIALPSVPSKRRAPASFGPGPIRVPQTTDPTIEAAQSEIKDTILPVLGEIMTRLDRARRDTHLPFEVKDGGGATLVTIDAGDIALFRATVALLAAGLELSVAYDLNPGSFDPSTIHDADGSGWLEPDEYCAPPPFFQHYKSNAWGQMLADLGIAVDDVQWGSQASRHSGVPTDPISPNDPDCWQGITEALATANQVEPALSGPINIDGLLVNLSAWASGGPSDLRSILPRYPAGLGDPTLPDPTLAGLFPSGIDAWQAADAVEHMLMGLYELNASP